MRSALVGKQHRHPGSGSGDKWGIYKDTGIELNLGQGWDKAPGRCRNSLSFSSHCPSLLLFFLSKLLSLLLFLLLSLSPLSRSLFSQSPHALLHDSSPLHRCHLCLGNIFPAVRLSSNRTQRAFSLSWSQVQVPWQGILISIWVRLLPRAHQLCVRVSDTL